MIFIWIPSRLGTPLAHHRRTTARQDSLKPIFGRTNQPRAPLTPVMSQQKDAYLHGAFPARGASAVPAATPRSIPCNQWLHIFA